jgi:hypothetical protein
LSPKRAASCRAISIRHSLLEKFFRTGIDDGPELGANTAPLFDSSLNFRRVSARGFRRARR